MQRYTAARGDIVTVASSLMQVRTKTTSWPDGMATTLKFTASVSYLGNTNGQKLLKNNVHFHPKQQLPEKKKHVCGLILLRYPEMRPI